MQFEQKNGQYPNAINYANQAEESGEQARTIQLVFYGIFVLIIVFSIFAFKKYLKKERYTKILCSICKEYILANGVKCLQCKDIRICYFCDEDFAEVKRRGMNCNITPGVKISERYVERI